MCGLAGFLTNSKSTNFSKILTEMGSSLSHRGPDDQGIWFDENIGIGFSHRRLSILDLTHQGHQPMHSESSQFTMIFNGEIYNHNEIRLDIENLVPSTLWNSSSDTETILKSFELKGINDTIISLIGMFSIVLFDKFNNTLTLIRDRIGEKPLYYGWQNSSFLFGSELKALKIHPDFENKIDNKALNLYFKYNYIPAPHSIYKDIFKLMPGCILTLNINSHEININSYWNLIDIVNSNKLNKITLKNEVEILKELESKLKEAIKSQMLSDVPLGAFLSGGIDSSLIVSLMQSISSTPIKTFTIGFENSNYNEADHAKKISKYLGTDHTELYVSSTEAISVIKQLSEIYDEPFSDSSQIPTYLIAKLAKEKVSVVLSGDAGDELFGGYNRYYIAQQKWRKYKLYPFFIKIFIINLIKFLSPRNWDKFYKLITIFSSHNTRIKNFGDKLYKFSHVLSSKNENELYDKFITHWSNEDKIVLDAEKIEIINFEKLNAVSTAEKMMVTDMLSYLPDDILVKLDRAAMMCSLETRVPFLDRRVIEYAFQINMNLKIRNNQTKWVLRKLLYKYIPKELIEKPKMGFSVPIDEWLRGPLREWAEELISEDKLIKDGILNPIPIRRKWDEHLSGKYNWQYHIWDVLIFQLWLGKQTN